VAPDQIDRLADHPGAIDDVARWHFEEWGVGPVEEGLERGRRRLRSWATAGGVPCAYVAVVSGEICGSASLVEHDMPGPPAGTEHLRPWLSGVFVIPERRKAGLGPALVATVEEAAGTLGYPTLYLYTAPVTARKFYAPQGWEVILTPSYEGKEVAVMAKSLVVPGKLG
jgi:GNAT superfamily N-acetyltransferase